MVRSETAAKRFSEGKKPIPASSTFTLVGMKPYLKKAPSDSSSVVSFQQNAAEFPSWHYHPEYELTLMLGSRGQRLVGDDVAEYESGDLVLLGPNLPHSWRPATTRRDATNSGGCLVLQFRHDFLGEHFFKLREMGGVDRLLRSSMRGLAFGHTPTGSRVSQQLALVPALSPARRLATLLSVLVELASEKNARHLSTLKVKPVCRVTDQRRLDAICRYLHEHFQEEIEFADLATHLRIDQASLCRFFKQATGRTMTAYVNELRVGAAAELLIDTDESVLNIGFRVGFGNYSNFNRQFKRIKGLGPRTLRRQFTLLSSGDLEWQPA
jgi:AraC-like DNA-binding protein/quercetin dioxygenase-like cupin family protein